MSNYPASLDSDSSLYVAHDYITTKLAAAQAIGDTVAVVANPTGWVANMVLSVDVGKTNAEQQLVTAVAGNVLTVTRAFGGTSASAHAANAVVGNNIDAVYQSSAKSAIIAIETALGAGLSNVVTTAAFTSSSPTQSSAFNFTPIVSGAGVSVGGGTLVVGNNAVTFSTVPAGVNGTDTQHYLYVSNGSGTAEACLITGGAGVAGASNGVIIINCAHTHSGSWTIQSASGGIKEASVYLNGVGTIVLPRATVNIYGTVVLPSAISLQGQGYSTTGPTGTVLSCLSASPAIVIADGLGSADGQGVGVHSNYYLLGPGSGATSGIFVGGDPANVFAPTAWYGSFTRFYNVECNLFKYALTLQNCNFLVFHDCIFGGANVSGARALLVPSTAGAAGMQPVEFHGCLLSVYSGVAVQMDYSGFGTSSFQFFGGQVSGVITGTAIDWHSFGTHYEPNPSNEAIIASTSGGIIQIVGGLMSTHGASTPYHISVTGGIPMVTLKDITIQCDSATTVPVWATISSGTGARVCIENINVLFAGTFTALYALAGAALNAFELNIDLIGITGRTQVAGAATLAFPIGNYPHRGLTQITGATVGGSGITAVSGLLFGQTGMIEAFNGQTFTAGATIGNTITLTANLPYSFYFDGTQIWIK